MAVIAGEAVTFGVTNVSREQGRLQELLRWRGFENEFSKDADTCVVSDRKRTW